MNLFKSCKNFRFMTQRENKSHQQKPCFSADQNLLKECYRKLPNANLVSEFFWDDEFYNFQNAPYTENKLLPHKQSFLKNPSISKEIYGIIHVEFCWFPLGRFWGEVN